MRQMMAIVAFAALGGVTLTSTAASAMPNGMTATAKQVVGQTSNIQEVRWVRDARGRRVWRAGPRRFVAVGPRRVWRGGWRGAYAWCPAPVWRPGPVRGPSPGWGPRPGWGWNSGWW
jgi:hypothetical protein